MKIMCAVFSRMVGGHKKRPHLGRREHITCISSGTCAILSMANEIVSYTHEKPPSSHLGGFSCVVMSLSFAIDSITQVPDEMQEIRCRLRWRFFIFVSG